MDKKGLTIVLTGDGKGKTTSALGMIIRALGHKKKVCLIQFLKSSDSNYGEFTVLNQLGVENYQMGAGCTWVANKKETELKAIEAWNLTREKVYSKNFDMIILDEIIHALNFPNTIGKEVIKSNDIVDLIKNKPCNLTLVLTGRYAPNEIIDMADTVSEIQCIKHHYHEGVKAIPGIEF